MMRGDPRHRLLGWFDITLMHDIFETSKSTLDAKTYTAVGLVFLALLTLPIGRVVELPTLLMAIAGIWLLWHRRTRLYDDPAQRLYAWLFLAIWLPILISLIGAVHLPRSLNDGLAYIRLYLAGVFVIAFLAEPRRQELLIRLAALMLAFWLFDALVQAIRGVDLFGYAYVPGRLNAVYGERHLDFGVALSTLSPLLLYALRNRPAWLLVALVITGVVVFLAGSRGGWVSYAVVCSGLLVHFVRRGYLTKQQALVMVAILMLAASAVAWQHPQARARMETTLGLFSGEAKVIDAATSHRLTLWQVAQRMIVAHPINGVGIGGFRHAYPEFADPDDLFVDKQSGVGAFYAHQLLIQVASETGIIGLLGLMVFFWLWWRSWKQADDSTRQRMLPFGLAVLAWMFPFNTHASFYGAQWSQLIWLLLALYCAGLSTRARA